MSKITKLFTMVLVLSACFTSLGWSFGEGILAQTGQYTFFINPCPPGGPTYYQKLVPCVVKETIQVPKTVFQTYPVPVPAKSKVPTLITEAPVGCAQGAGPCTTCYPKASEKKSTADMWGPRMMMVRVPYVEFTPKEITRRVMRPQWFAVCEEARPVRKVQKVRAGW
jgi:hypothetical protein